jgi:hypothetical protein
MQQTEDPDGFTVEYNGTALTAEWTASYSPERPRIPGHWASTIHGKTDKIHETAKVSPAAQSPSASIYRVRAYATLSKAAGAARKPLPSNSLPGGSPRLRHHREEGLSRGDLICRRRTGSRCGHTVRRDVSRYSETATHYGWRAKWPLAELAPGKYRSDRREGVAPKFIEALVGREQRRSQTHDAGRGK